MVTGWNEEVIFCAEQKMYKCKQIRAWIKPKFLIIVIKKNQYTKSQKHFLSFAKLPKTIQEYNFYREEYNFQASVSLTSTCIKDKSKEPQVCWQ